MFYGRLINARTLIIVAVGAAVASCGGGGGGGDDDPDDTTTTLQEDSFGLSFGAAFRADPNTEPSDPGPGDIIPVSLTSEPINII